MIIKQHPQIFPHLRARERKRNEMLESTRTCVLQPMVNGAFYLTKCKLFDAEGQQHHFSSSYEVVSSWNYFYVIFLLLVRKSYFLYQWVQEVVNLEVPCSIKYLLDFLSRARVQVLQGRICFPLLPFSVPTFTLLQMCYYKACALLQPCQFHKAHISPIGFKGSDTLWWFSARMRL